MLAFPSPPPEKKFGKVSLLNGDGSIITTGTIVTQGERTQYFGRIRMNPVLKVRSDEDGNTYEQAAWIARYNSQIKRESVYASDPVAAKAYTENVQKALDTSRTPRTPRTPRPMQYAPLQRTVFGIPRPPPSSTLIPLNLAPLPLKLDLPPLPPMITPPRLI
jgi:hypothetical protein